MEYHRVESRGISSPLSCVIVMFLLLLLVHGAGTCGPGKTANWKERGMKRPVPMKLREHIPMTSESSLQASGPSEKVKKGTPAYEALLSNRDPDIIVRDDKGTGNNRRMSRRCEQKLKTLSALVREYWNGDIKVRVVRAYDDGSGKRRRHGPHSLHFSGRAVDITTSDEKRDKLPMLGRLACNAGFDWVYRARGYIHASVKSDDEDEQESPGCFHADSTVQLHDGRRVAMQELRVGDKVASLDSNGNIAYSPIIMFMHRSPKTITDFITIKTENHQSELAITPTHLIYKINKHARREQARLAKEIAVGDYVYIRNQSEAKWLSAGRVSSIERVERVGVFAPLTETGNMLVDDVLASCYAIIPSEIIAHWSLAPVRFVTYFYPSLMDTGIDYEGIHWYPQTLLTVYSTLEHLWGVFL